MTIDEVIIELTKDKLCAEAPIDKCVKIRCNECECRSYIEFKDILPVLLETKKELEAYKKALEISCEWNELNLGYLNVDECLQKAREEMDEEKLIGGNNYGR